MHLKESKTGEVKVDISLLIPAYNEVKNIVPLAEQIAQFIRTSPYRIEAVLVDDGSTDQTWEAIEACRNKYDFVISRTHSENMGKTAALTTAFHASSGRYVVFFDADLQYMPECLPDLVAPLEQGYDLVTGWKDGNYDKSLVSSFYNGLCRRVFRNIHVHDLNAIKAMRREVFQTLHLRKDWHRYIAVMAADKGYKIKEVKVKLYPRMHGDSKFSGKSRILIGFFDLLSVKFLLSFSKKPLLFFGVAGLGLILSGVAVGVGAIAARVFFKAGFRPILYLVMLLITVGFNLFALGFLAELVLMVREKVEMLERNISEIRSDEHDAE